MAGRLPESFMVGNTNLGTVLLDGSGVATFMTLALSAGKYNIKAVYAGSSANTGSSSGTVTQMVK